MLSIDDITVEYRQLLGQISRDGVNYIATFDDSGGAPVTAALGVAGCVGMCFGTTTKKLYVYDGSAWLASAALT